MMFEKLIAGLPRLLANYSASVLGSLLFLIAAWIFAVLVDRLIRRVLKNRTDLDPSYVAIMARTTRIVVLVLAFIAVLEELGVEIASLIAALGIFGFAIALGLRTPLANFFTGMMIYVLKPYGIGDHIEGERVEGAVESIGAFHTVVVTNDGTYASVPNSAMWARSIKNHSRPRPRRVDVNLTVGLEIAFGDLRPAIEKAVLADPDTNPLYPPTIKVSESRESSLRLRVSAWCEPERAWAFGTRLKTLLREAAAGAGASVMSASVVRRKRPAPEKPAAASAPAADEAA